MNLVRLLQRAVHHVRLHDLGVDLFLKFLPEFLSNVAGRHGADLRARDGVGACIAENHRADIADVANLGDEVHGSVGADHFDAPDRRKESTKASQLRSTCLGDP